MSTAQHSTAYVCTRDEEISYINWVRNLHMDTDKSESIWWGGDQIKYFLKITMPNFNRFRYFNYIGLSICIRWFRNIFVVYLKNREILFGFCFTSTHIAPLIFAANAVTAHTHGKNLIEFHRFSDLVRWSRRRPQPQQLGVLQHQIQHSNKLNLLDFNNIYLLVLSASFSLSLRVWFVARIWFFQIFFSLQIVSFSLEVLRSNKHVLLNFPKTSKYSNVSLYVERYLHVVAFRIHDHLLTFSWLCCLKSDFIIHFFSIN